MLFNVGSGTPKQLLQWGQIEAQKRRFPAGGGKGNKRFLPAGPQAHSQRPSFPFTSLWLFISVGGCSVFSEKTVSALLTCVTRGPASQSAAHCHHTEVLHK